ncbi:MAG: AAA family ATPase [Sutterellaceae bacterium]|nr:AAA family ATPase [Sutterellaceae bacterium]
MIILITGASHTGKTLLAQQLLERLHYPTLSIDLLKMGLIRSRQTTLTPEDDEALEDYLWPIVRETIRTAIENGQHLIVEGGYIPIDWQASFAESEIEHIRFACLVMDEDYIREHFDDIREHADAIEKRLDDSGLTVESVLEDNAHYLALCRKFGVEPLLIEGDYSPQALVERICTTV